MQVIGNQLPTKGVKEPHRPKRVVWPVFLAAAAVLLVGAFFIRPRSGTAIPYAVETLYPGPVEATVGPNVLIICIDALRPDHMSLYGYERDTTPRIMAVFGDATIFNRAYAPAAVTTPSVVSLLTGLYPQNHGVRMLGQKVPDPTVLVSDHVRRAGYQTAAVVSNAVLSDSASGLASRFDLYDARLDQNRGARAHVLQRNAQKTTDAAINWLHYTRAPDRPHFLYVHYADPQAPYEPLPDKPADFTHQRPMLVDLTGHGGSVQPEGTVDSLELIDRYDEEIAYTDREVGRLLHEYRDLGLLDDALVILCADHGESMMEHDCWFGHGVHVHQELIRIPLAVRYQDLKPQRVETTVSLIDVTPTILVAAGLPVPAVLDGKSLFAPVDAREIFAEARGVWDDDQDDSHSAGLWRCLIRGDTKVVARIGNTGSIRSAQMFDLLADPKELNPSPATKEEPAFRALADFIASDPNPAGLPKNVAWGDLPGPNVAPSADPETLGHLRSLGYVQ
ncbi:MAG: sulfatase [Phycisphaerales bacterium]|nr:MAG: sulfatase [Phycisphaerales bacterium]